MCMKNKYNLPNLPVPDLQETFETLLNWSKPLVSEKEFKNLEEDLKNFLNTNISKELQTILYERAEDKDNSWLVDWWVEKMYLVSRGPLAMGCNVPFELNFSNFIFYVNNILFLFI